MGLAGAGAAGIDAQWGHQFLGNNGRLYSRAWANGTGRAVSIRGLTNIGGIYFLAAGTFLDLQSLQDGTPLQVGTNLFLGISGVLGGAPIALGATPAFLINNIYPDGFQGYMEDWANLPGGYDGLR
jgi:hypothetical protein